MKKIKLTQNKYALVDDGDFGWLNQFKWCVVQGKYAHRNVGGGKWIRMHRLIMKAPSGTSVDHINGNTLDNRRSNLRLCSHRENTKNMQLSRANSTGIKDVYWDTSRGRWAVQIMSDGKKYYGGRFVNLKSAVVSRDKLIKQLHGSFARTEVGNV
jgi:hypothetical protein